MALFYQVPASQARGPVKCFQIQHFLAVRESHLLRCVACASTTIFHALHALAKRA